MAEEKPKRLCAFQPSDPNAPKHVGLTKQHVFGDWMNNLFGRDQRHRAKFTNYRQDASPVRIGGYKKSAIRPGTITTMQLRVVCSDCNNGWMRALEEKARPTVEKLVRGEAVVLDAQAQLAVAAWATQVSIISEYYSEEGQIVSQDQRDQFRLTGVPSSGWTVWIGYYLGGSYRHFATQSRTWDRVAPIPNSTDTEKGDVSLSVYVLGHLFCHVFYRSHQRTLLAPPTLPGLIRIWPIATPIAVWPVLPKISDPLIGGLMQSFRRFTSNSFYPERE